jgi:hypothetical protein
MRNLEFYRDWEQHNGKIVTIDGIKHKIIVDVFHAIFPYQHDAISVQAEAVNKNTEYYLSEKDKLGDDWSVDVLDSDVTLTANVFRQCQEQDAIMSGYAKASK